MTAIRYVEGDATRPQNDGVTIIAHVCNDIGAWGAGFVLALSRRWASPETAYKQWFAARDSNDFALGATQFVQVKPTVWVANMVGQRDVRRKGDGTVPIRYWAIDSALASVGDRAVELDASVHMPRIGCGLAGGKWAEVELLIQRNLSERDIEVAVYDLPRR